MTPRYLAYAGSRDWVACDSLVEACEAANRMPGARIYEPLAMTAAERIHAEPMDVTCLSLDVARLEEEKAALLAACEAAWEVLTTIEYTIPRPDASEAIQLLSAFVLPERKRRTKSELELPLWQ